MRLPSASTASPGAEAPRPPEGGIEIPLRDARTGYPSASRAALAVFLALATAAWFIRVRPLAVIAATIGGGLHLGGYPFSRVVFLDAWKWHGVCAAAAALIPLASLGWGGPAAVWAGGAGMHGLARLVTGLGLGGLAALGLGLLGLLHLPVAASLGAVGGFGALLGFVRRRPRFRLELPAVLRSPGGAVILASLAVMALASTLMALGPEGGWDALYYHFRLPKLWTMEHRIRFIPYIFPSHYPGTVEGLYTLGWLMGGEETAKLWNLMSWFLCGAAVWRLAGPLGEGTALRAVALALTMPIAGTLAAEGYIDLTLTLFELLALDAALAGRTAAAGMFIGFAMGSKYTGVFAAIGLLAAMASMRRRRRALAAAAAAAVLPVLPWLVRNLLFTGNPVAPLLSRAIGGLEWAGGFDQTLMASMVPKLYPENPIDSALLPLTALWGFAKMSVFAVFSPFVLGMFPVLVFPAPTPRLRAFRVYTLAFTAAAVVLAPDARYWQPVAFALCIPVASAWIGLERTRAKDAVAVAALGWLAVPLCAAFHLGVMDRELPGVYAVSLGLDSKVSYYIRRRSPTGYASTVAWMNSRVPAGSRIPVISEVQAYLLARDAFFDTDASAVRWLDRLAVRRGSGADWARQFRQWNARAVFVSPTRAAGIFPPRKWTPAEVRAMADFWERRARLVFREGECEAYYLDSPGERVPKPDLPGGQEWWLVRMNDSSDKPDVCRKLYREALAAGVRSARLHMVFGGFMLNAKANREAVAALAQATAADPINGEAWYWYTAGLMRIGKEAEAKRAFDKGVACAPNHPLRKMFTGPPFTK